MLKLFNTIIVLLLLCPVLIINAQTKDSVRSKLKKLDGEAKKITIQTDKGAVTFEGDEADYLLKKMKKAVKPNSFTFAIPEGDYFNGEDFEMGDNFASDEPAFNFKMDHMRMPHPPKVNVFRRWNDNEDGALFDHPNRKITIEKENGKTKITVKRNDGDDEITESYEGEDAEKYLKELNKDEPFSLDLKNKDKDSDKKDTRIIIIK